MSERKKFKSNLDSWNQSSNCPSSRSSNNLSIHSLSNSAKKVNILEFIQFRGDPKIGESDYEWMKDLRIPPDINLNKYQKEPNFYQRDLEKYKLKVRNDSMMNKNVTLSGPINIAKFEQIVKNPFESSNPSIITFGYTLRNNVENTGWKCVSISPKKNLFDKLLPPVTKSCKINYQKLKDKIVLLTENKLEKRVFHNESLIKKNTSHSNIAIRMMGEHLASKPYDEHYKIKNVNSFRHLLSNENINSTNQWGCGLRDEGEDFENKIKKDYVSNRDFYMYNVLKKRRAKKNK